MPIEKYLKKHIYYAMEINKQRSTVRSSASEAIIDQGLRSYMLKVYNYMASGVLLTGFVALFFFKMAVVTSAAVSYTHLTLPTIPGV